MFSRQINDDYSSRITRGIAGFPHKRRLDDISKCCSKFKDLCTLDIGCNDLYFDQRIIPNQKIFVGCDLGWEDGLQKARENVIKHHWTNVHLIKSLGEHIPLTKNYFDFVLCCETLEHVNNEISVINEIKRVSRENSILVISAPIEFGPILFFKEFIRKLLYNSKEYSFKELVYACIFCDLKYVKRVKGDHKGYDYKNTISYLSPDYVLINKINTPFEYLPDYLSYGTILIFRKSHVGEK